MNAQSTAQKQMATGGSPLNRTINTFRMRQQRHFHLTQQRNVSHSGVNHEEEERAQDDM